jgi:hypothetical protein
MVHVTAAKFKPLIFSVSGLALSNVANIFIFMILDDLLIYGAMLYIGDCKAELDGVSHMRLKLLRMLNSKRNGILSYYVTKQVAQDATRATSVVIHISCPHIYVTSAILTEK